MGKKVHDGITKMGKNLLTTQVFWGVIFTLFLAASPKLEELVGLRRFRSAKKAQTIMVQRVNLDL